MRVFTGGNVLGYILKDHVVDQFPDKLVIVQAVSLELLGFIDHVVVNDSCPHLKLRLHDLYVSCNLNELAEGESIALTRGKLSVLEGTPVERTNYVGSRRQDVEGGFGCPHKASR